jgi:hypothetical protein
MKIFNIKWVMGLGAVLLLTSCLKKNDMNIDPDATTANVAELQFIATGGTTINSGMQYFSGGALLLSPLDAVDTANYNINIAGAAAPDKDVTVTIGIKKSAILDNYSSDSINYELMPDSIYSLVSTTATIKAGSRVAHMQIKFYPTKVDFTRSYMLPVVITNASGVNISSNFGIVYFHIIGNPIAGSYLWDFYRYNNQDGSGAPYSSWANESTVFVPVTPTSIKVPTGYYVQPNYLITFSNTNGVLSNFKAVIAPDEIGAAFTANGITMVTGPTISVSTDYKTFTLKYVVSNGSGYRNITDIFHKP